MLIFIFFFFFFFFFTKKVRTVFYTEEIQSSADSKMTKMIKLLTFDILFPPLRDILAKTCCRMMTAHWRALVSIENLVLVVVLVLESKALYFRSVHNRALSV